MAWLVDEEMGDKQLRTVILRLVLDRWGTLLHGEVVDMAGDVKGADYSLGRGRSSDQSLRGRYRADMTRLKRATRSARAMARARGRVRCGDGGDGRRRFVRAEDVGVGVSVISRTVAANQAVARIEHAFVRTRRSSPAETHRHWSTWPSAYFDSKRDLARQRHGHWHGRRTVGRYRMLAPVRWRLRVEVLGEDADWRQNWRRG